MTRLRPAPRARRRATAVSTPLSTHHLRAGTQQRGRQGELRRAEGSERKSWIAPGTIHEQIARRLALIHGRAAATKQSVPMVCEVRHQCAWRCLRLLRLRRLPRRRCARPRAYPT